MDDQLKSECLACGSYFERKNCKKFCSAKCQRFLSDKRRAERNSRAVMIEKQCIVCQENFAYNPKSHPERGERVFCGRSCASKHYIQKGAYDNWRLRCDPKQGETRFCAMCSNMVYYTQGQIEKGKRRVCSKVCHRKLMSSLFSDGKGPMCGKKLTPEQKQKQKDTMTAKHGVTNSYALAKNRGTVSKPQRWLYDELIKIYECKLETWVQKLHCHIDILFDEQKLVIEFMGDYWHCNPTIYAENYYNKKKGMLAKDIWKHDEDRRNKITRQGYTLIEVWESEYRTDRNLVLNDLQRKINEHIEKTKNTIHF